MLSSNFSRKDCGWLGDNLDRSLGQRGLQHYSFIPSLLSSPPSTTGQFLSSTSTSPSLHLYFYLHLQFIFHSFLHSSPAKEGKGGLTLLLLGMKGKSALSPPSSSWEEFNTAEWIFFLIYTLRELPLRWNHLLAIPTRIKPIEGLKILLSTANEFVVDS